MLSRALVPSLVLFSFAGLIIALPASRAGTSRGEDQPGAALDPPPPLSGGQPVQVYVGVYVTNLAQVDEVLEQLHVKGTLFARWQDSRLSARPGGSVETVSLLRPDEIWRPELEMINALTPREQQDLTITVDSTAWSSAPRHLRLRCRPSFACDRFPSTRNR